MPTDGPRPRAACACGRGRRHSRRACRRCGSPGGTGSAPRHGCRRWRCRPRGPPWAGRSPRRSRHSCGSRRAGSCAARATPLPGRRCRRRRSAGRGAASGLLDRGQRAFDQIAKPAVVLDDRRLGEAAVKRGFAVVEGQPANALARSPRSASARAGCRNGVQRMVSPRPPSRHADGVMPSLSLASL